jgi:REP element-mobilizing transposase RayT
MLPEITRLRRRDQYRAIRRALARTAHREDCRICQFSIQANHVHLIVEPRSKDGLARGMIAFKTSCARRLNGVVGRRGRVLADRYHARYLINPAQVRRALVSHHSSHLAGRVAAGRRRRPAARRRRPLGEDPESPVAVDRETAIVLDGCCDALAPSVAE